MVVVRHRLGQTPLSPSRRIVLATVLRAAACCVRRRTACGQSPMSTRVSVDQPCEHVAMPDQSSDAVQALLIVDIQTAFVTGDEAAPASEHLLVNLSDLLQRARRAGALVMHLQNDGPPGAVDEPGRAGWELYFPAAESSREVVVRKLTDDGFDGTALDEFLRRHGVGRVCVVGVMSEMCVLATARAALARKFGGVMPHDGHATFDISPAPGMTDGVPAAMASRVAEWALGDEVGALRRRPTFSSSRSPDLRPADDRSAATCSA